MMDNTLETERLFLKVIDAEDAPFLFRLMNTPKWHKMIGDRGIHTVSDALKYMKERMDADLSKKGFVNYVMIQKETNENVGTCSLHNREGVDGLDIGYALLPTYEGYGYASEGAQAMINLAFNKHDLDSVNAITDDVNLGSHKVLEKLGFEMKGYIGLPNEKERIRLYKLTKTNN